MLLEKQVARAKALVERIPWLPAGLESLKAEERAGSSLLAGGLAYRLFFWIVAFGLVAAAALSFWVRAKPDDAEDTAKSFGLAGVATRSARSAVEDGSKARWYFLVIGVVLLLYFGMGAVRALRVSAILAWQLDPARMKKPLRSSAAFSGFLIVAFGAGLGAQWVRHHAPGTGIGATIATGALFVAAALLAYRALPHPPGIEWRALLPGAIELGVGLVGIQLFVAYYLAAKLERSPQLYGSLGTATVVLLWLFLFSRLLVSGMFLNATLHRRRQARS